MSKCDWFIIANGVFNNLKRGLHYGLTHLSSSLASLNMDESLQNILKSLFSRGFILFGRGGARGLRFSLAVYVFNMTII